MTMREVEVRHGKAGIAAKITTNFLINFSIFVDAGSLFNFLIQLFTRLWEEEEHVIQHIMFYCRSGDSRRARSRPRRYARYCADPGWGYGNRAARG
jgi:hypothetical protein